MKNKYILPVLWVCMLSFAFNLNAQDYTSTIQNYMDVNASKIGLNPAEVDFTITSATTLNNKDVKVVYLQQEIAGVMIASTSATVLIKDGEVVHFNHSFIPEVANMTQLSSPSLSAHDAVLRAVNHLNLNGVSNVMATNYKTSEDELIENIQSSEFESPSYYALSNSNYVLTHEVIVKDAQHWWVAKIDASTGELVSVMDAMLSCSFDGTEATDENPHAHKFHTTAKDNGGESVLTGETTKTAFNAETVINDGAVYNAYPLRVESPAHGVGNGDDDGDKRVILMDPANIAANGDGVVPSPFGWHDVDGADGAESTFTIGNNTSAYLDVFENDSPQSNDDYSDGGANLIFNNPLDLTMEPTEYQPAAVDNLFVWNNLMHDVWYNYGFDETSGNFQENSYDREVSDGNGAFGYGSDSVNAEAQDESQTATPASNNANMGTSSDGSNPRMQMYLWGASPFGNYTTINSPSELAGVYFSSRFPFQPLPGPDAPATSDLLVVMDDATPYLGDDGGTPGASTATDDGCTSYAPGFDATGKILLIRRGVCAFATKIRRASEAGAIGVIMANNDEANPDAVALGGGTPDGPINIPAVMVSFNVGDALIQAVNAGTVVNGTIVDPEGGGVSKDGDLDQGIVAHEYGHGISTRMTGGRVRFDCLLSLEEGTNAEQMGEGWSDWFALVMTQELNDTAMQRRGIGTYVLGQTNDGAGIRPAPYSTDMAENPYTYGDLPNDEITIPHGVGFVWSTFIWDMYWALIDKHGFDPDIYNGTGGNNIAMRLVMDGIKIQNCDNVGFVEGRNSIITADAMVYGGENECEIRRAFARRGVGASASQGSGASRLDQVENFDVNAPGNTTPPPFTVGDCEAVIGIEDFNNTIFTVFPNPAKNQININSNVNNGIAAVSMFDINGRQVMNLNVDLANTGIVNTSSLSTGVYVIKIETDNATHTQKLVIN